MRSSVGACLIFALVAALPFQPWAKTESGASFFEVSAQSDESGLATLYFDVGRGINERDSAVAPVAGGRTSVLRFALPAGRLRSLALVPLDRDVRMTLGGARILDRSGQALASVSPEQFKPAAQISAMTVREGQLVVATERDASRPTMDIVLASPLELPQSRWWEGTAVTFLALVAAVGALAWARRSRRMDFDRRAASLWAAAEASPGRTVSLIALVATLLANYPVVFAGKSFVSPNLGTALLYGSNPWVPGFQSVERGNANSADIDALMWQHVPYSMLEYRALFRDGELPLWNRYNSAGTPLLAQGQTGLGDPLHLIPLLADGAAWSWDLRFLLTKFLLSCGVGLCVWRLTRSLSVALLLAVSAQFIGFFVFRVNHPAVFSLCYSPWILYCWLRVADSRSMRGAVLGLVGLLAANLAELTSGTVKEADMLLICLNLAGALLVLVSARSVASKLALLVMAGLQGIVFALIGAPVWYTFYRALKHSYTMYNVPQAFQLQPGMSAALFDELFYRPFQIFSNVINPSANFFILLGVLWAVVRWRQVLANRYAVALAASALPAVALVYGVIPPGVVTRIPYLGNILHVDNTFSCPLIILLAMIAGVGWKEAFASLGSPEGKREGTAVLVLLLALYAAYLGTAQAVVRSAYAPQTWGALIKVGTFVHLYGLSLVAGSALLLATIHSARRGSSWTPALVLLAALGFATLHWRHGLQVATAFPDYVIAPTSRVDLRADSAAIDAIRGEGTGPVRSVGFVDSFFPGWSGAYDLEGIEGADSLINPYYRELVDAAGMERVWDWRYKLEDRDLESVRPLLDVLNVRFYLDYPAGQRAARKGLKPFRSADMETYESPSYWPRAFFTDRVAVYDQLPQYMGWIKAVHRQPFAAMQHRDWIRISPTPAVSGEIAGRQVRAAEDYQLTTNTTAFTVAASGPGFIVLSEAFESDNFHVTANGVEVPYFRMNHAFKGIYVDAPGTYRVKFTYWPRGLSTSLLVCGIGLGIVLLEVAAAVFLLKQGSGAEGVAT